MTARKKSPPTRAVVRADAALPAGYASFLDGLKARICAAQGKAALAVNAELVLLYWRVGRDILVRQEQEGWGARVIDRLSTDLRAAFPEMRGFSPRNPACTIDLVPQPHPARESRPSRAASLVLVG